MKKKYNYLIGLLFATLFAACSEEEVQPFSDAPGVNFMERTVASNGKVSWGEGYTALSLSVNFVDSFYAKGIYGVEEREIPLRVQLEGLLNDTPLKVKFKVLPVEKEEYDLAEVIVPEEPVEIKADAPVRLSHQISDSGALPDAGQNKQNDAVRRCNRSRRTNC